MLVHCQTTLKNTLIMVEIKYVLTLGIVNDGFLRRSRIHNTNQGNKTPALLCIGADISKFFKIFQNFWKILMLQMLPNLIRNKVLKCCFGGFCFKKNFISKLKNITNVASMRIANLTPVRIAMTSPMQRLAKRGGLLPWPYLT